ncbi:SidA/IucD/PvdA family monooxygenase [Janibacter melonis]|uniref:SidA/IucD/PvdA family monooxygenase n=1 Tax=Janibacter melonis TaxID=262209 RepID=UPI00209576C0|nr:SidA/IucD/PvdA family monooxygenase [Janibacter melonis]
MHSGHYLQRRDDLAELDHVTVVGSGQSAAEIYHDLLQRAEGTGRHVAWVTRSPRFFPMEYTKLTLEMTSPDYARYHRELPEPVRAGLARSQRHLYKGISSELVDAIYDTLYRIEVEQGGVATTLATSSELRGGRDEDGRTVLDLHHLEQDRGYTLTTDAVVLSTGTPAGPRDARPCPRAPAPRRARPARHRRRLPRRPRRARRAPRPRLHAERRRARPLAHRPDLGMGAWRNSVILADLLGEEIYRRAPDRLPGLRRPRRAGAPRPPARPATWR